MTCEERKKHLDGMVAEKKKDQPWLVAQCATCGETWNPKRSELPEGLIANWPPHSVPACPRCSSKDTYIVKPTFLD